MPQLTQDRTKQQLPGILQALLDIAVPNATANTVNQANSINKDTTNRQQQLSVSQEAARKGIQKAVQEMSYNAVAEGGPDVANHIEKIMNLNQQPQMSMAQPQMSMMPQQPQGIQQDNSYIQNNPFNREQTDVGNGPPNSSMNKGNIDPQEQIRENLIQQLLRESQAPKGILGRMLEGFAMGTGYTQNKLNSLKSISESAGLMQTQSGEEKIQPYQKLQQDVEIMKQNISNRQSMYSNIIAQENEISKQYVNDIEPLKLSTDAMGKITSIYEDSLNNPNNNVNDFFLVYNAIKAADPTAVKEGEYKTVQDLLPLAQKILNVANFSFKGETLTPSQRARIIKAAITQHNGLVKRFEPLVNEYRKKVESYDGDSDRALTNYGSTRNKNDELIKVMKERGLL